MAESTFPLLDRAYHRRPSRKEKWFPSVFGFSAGMGAAWVIILECVYVSMGFFDERGSGT